jgi:FkbM family methyltransferase
MTPNAGPRVVPTRSFPQWLLDEVSLCDIDLRTPPRVILDIGANIGAYSVRCAQKWPGVHIHAYEPDPINFEALSKNLANYSRCTPHLLGVRDQNCISPLHLGDTGCVHSFITSERDTGNTVAVHCIAAADLPKADIIKIDTEGLELEILTHLKLDGVTALVIEYHSAEDRAFITTYCTSKGFDLVQHLTQHGDANGQLKFARPGTYIPLLDVGCSMLNVGCSPKFPVFIGIPIAGSAPVGFIGSIVRYVRRAPKNTTIAFDTNSGLVAMARNNFVWQFLQTDADRLLMLDSDLIFEPEHVERILSHDEDIVGGCYPIKGEGELSLCGNGLLNREEPIRPDGLQRLRYIGTGFMCIRRHVIEAMIEADRAEIEYQKDEPPHRTQWDLFRMGVRPTADARRRYLTEDWFFCQRANELGFKVWADTQVCLRHIGTAIWPLPHQREQPTPTLHHSIP